MFFGYLCHVKRTNMYVLGSSIQKYVKVIGILLLLCLYACYRVAADDNRENSPILIISSYNPETSQTARNISEFLDEYRLLGGTAPVIIENMNCKSFSESWIWEHQMYDILEKYQNSRAPSLILLLGQEAWTSYLSLDDIDERHTPILCGMVSKNAVLLPPDSIGLKTWEPESVNFEEQFGKKYQIAGYAYDYDIETNIRLILKLYPHTKYIAFISDNSYGGVSMQALIKEKIKQFPDLQLLLLDGRQHTIYTLVDQIATLPEDAVIMVGTWRVDKNEGYFMKNATYSMMSANPHIPAFTIASVGLGHWVIGGYSPQYRTVGKDLARQAVRLEKEKKFQGGLSLISNQYSFDYNKITEFRIDQDLLPADARFINKEQTFLERYIYEIWAIGIVFVLLVLALVVTLLFYWRTKRLKDELQASEVELLAAKERAEESDRLKSAFLANMSHEIRTPLNAIVGFSNVLIAGECSEEEAKQFVGVIQTNSDLLLRLIGDILDISRLETGRLKFTYEQCELVALCQRVMATTSCGKQAGVEYIFMPHYESFTIETDVQRLQQILINLLSNANKFTSRGSITLDFQEDKEKRMVVFRVTDTGCGIPNEKQEKVFERFEKLDEYAQGTGLGLAICRITINLLGGKIWVDKNYQEGARFIFTHPIVKHQN